MLDASFNKVVPTEALEDADVAAVGAAAALRERGQAERAKRQTDELVTLGSNCVNDAAATAVAAAGGAAALKRAMHRDVSLSSYGRCASVKKVSFAPYYVSFASIVGHF
jgi:hypothetical protein